MPFTKLQFRPGINKDQTNYSGEGGWWDADKIRFKNGFPQKVGGWQKYTTNTIVGICRQMFGWATTYGDNLLGVATNAQVYIEQGGYYNDITPLRTTTPSITPASAAFSTTAESSTVTVECGTAHSATTGNSVDISGAVSEPMTISFVGGGSTKITSGVEELPAVGTPVRFATTISLPSEFNTTTTYYVVQRTTSGIGSSIQVSETVGGTAISAATTGSGTHTLVQTIGGIPLSEINTKHTITVTSSTAFTFEVTTPASQTTSGVGGTAATISFGVLPGNLITTAGVGWGVGTWGRDEWGLGATGTSGPNLPQTDWWFDNFDNDLYMNVRNGEGYVWERGTTTDPATSLATRAIRLVTYATNEGYTAASVPVKIMQLLVSQQDKHLVAFGAVPFGSTSASDFDPLLIRWADQDTPGDWTPSSTNTAGSLRLSRGSRIVRALPTRQEILIWTDTHLYTMQFLGTLDVFGVQEYADNISVMSPRSMATASNVTYWMGKDKFYAYTGRVQTLPCTLTSHVFDNFNFTQADQVISGTNEEWDEVWWFYPTEGSDYNDAYVVYNYVQQIWYYGTLARTAWLDSPLRQYPQASNTTVTDVDGINYGYVFDHEFGVDDDGSAMTAYIQSNDFDMGDGDQFMLSRRIIPDISFANSSAGTTPEATFEIQYRNFPGSGLDTDDDNARVIETTTDQFTDQIFIRVRARQMALKVSSANLGVNWKLGAPRIDMRQDGRR